MKCPNCQAKLMPVDGEMFCLQCGTAIRGQTGSLSDGPVLEETTDPLLQRAIVDVVNHQVSFRLPVAVAAPVTVAKPVGSFVSMRSVLAPPRPAAVGGGLDVSGPVLAQVAVARQVTASVTAPVGASVGVMPVKVGVGQLNLLPAVARSRRSWALGLPVSTWLWGLAVFCLFVGLNVSLQAYYSNRIYPGVRVGSVDLGGVAFGDVPRKLAGLDFAYPKLSVTAGGVRRMVDATEVGGVDVAGLERGVRDVGRDVRLPLVAVVQAWLSKPLTAKYVPDDEAVHAVAQGLVEEVSYRARAAAPMIVGGQAFVISERSGSELDLAKTEAAINGALGRQASVSVASGKLEPLVASSAYAPDVEQAQARMALSLQIKVRSAVYVPSAAQIGSWLVFGKPGMGVVVNEAGVGGYVASLPGRFDRKLATEALISAVRNGQALAYTASTKRVTSVPGLTNAAPGLPLASYKFCAAEGSRVELAKLMAASAWALDGRLMFASSTKDCDFRLTVAEAGVLSGFGRACEGKNSCEVGSELVINKAGWITPPGSWTGGVQAYRSEVVNHLVGHWLGFDHASCLDKKAALSVLQVPTVVLNGCSPDWFLVPEELVATKVFNSF